MQGELFLFFYENTVTILYSFYLMLNLFFIFSAQRLIRFAIWHKHVFEGKKTRKPYP